jgi:CheY-like chemotaxis protein
MPPHAQDDHHLNLRLVTRLLEANNFAVTAVADGGAALEALIASASPGGVPYDVAVLDTEMPVMRGPQVAAAFRQWEREHGAVTRLPIVALTAHAMEEHAAESAAAGCQNRCARTPWRCCARTRRRRWSGARSWPRRASASRRRPCPTQAAWDERLSKERDGVAALKTRCRRTAHRGCLVGRGAVNAKDG